MTFHCVAKDDKLVDTRVLVDEENNTIKIIIFDSQESRQNRVRKKQILNIQEFRPGRSAMQGHCGLRLFLKKHTVWVTVQCSTQWYSTKTSFYLSC